MADIERVKEQFKNEQFYLLGDITRASHVGEEGALVLVRAGGTVDGKTVGSRDTWIWVKDLWKDLFINNTDILEASYVSKLSARLFMGCSGLRRINTQMLNVNTNIRDALAGTSLRDFDASGIDFSNVSNAERLFSNSHLNNLDLSSWIGSSLTGTYAMFQNTIIDKNLIAPNLITSSVTGLNACFESAKIYGRIDISGWDTSNVTAFASLFAQPSGDAFKYLNIGNWDTHNVIDMRRCFQGVPAEELDLHNWDTRSCTDFTVGAFAMPNLRNLIVGPKFFLSTATIILDTAPNLGRANANNSNGWLEQFAQIAPIIRNKESEELLEEENGIWYINDNTIRSISLPSALKNKPWAQLYIPILQHKGYTIS